MALVATRSSSPDPLPGPHPGPCFPPPPAYDFEEEKKEEEGDADLAKIEQLKALMGAWLPIRHPLNPPLCAHLPTLASRAAGPPHSLRQLWRLLAGRTEQGCKQHRLTAARGWQPRQLRVTEPPTHPSPHPLTGRRRQLGGPPQARAQARGLLRRE